MFWCIALLPSSSVRGPQASGAPTPGSALTSREKELQTVFLEILVTLMFISSVSYFGGPPRTLQFLSSLRHFALKPYGWWNVARAPWTVTRQLLENAEPTLGSKCSQSITECRGWFCLLLSSICCFFFFLPIFWGNLSKSTTTERFNTMNTIFPWQVVNCWPCSPSLSFSLMHQSHSRVSSRHREFLPLNTSVYLF